MYNENERNNEMGNEENVTSSQTNYTAQSGDTSTDTTSYASAGNTSSDTTSYASAGNTSTDTASYASAGNTSTDTTYNTSGTGTESSTYRYDRSYYEQNRDENNSYQYQQTYTSAQAEDPKEAKKRAKQLKKQQRKAKNKGRAPKVAIAVAGLVAVAAVSVGSTYASFQLFKDDSSDKMVIQSTNSNAASTVKKVSTTNSESTVVTTDVSSMVSDVMPSVVTISNVGTETYNSLFGQSGTYEYTSSGSGIIVGQSDDELLIATNHHVISGSDKINVTFVDGKEYTANIKGSDSTIDIAVIAISLSDLDDDTLNQIKVATLGDSSKLSVGEPAIAIGNAMGYGQSVTTGVISALNREVTVDNVTNTLIQTDAAINPGNSGGALLNMDGEVVGINSSKLASTEVEGMGYAIAISDVADSLENMMNAKARDKVDNHGILGITGSTVSDEAVQIYGIPQGVFVSKVTEDGPAADAGITKNMVITEFDGKTITSIDQLVELLQYYEPKEKIDVIVAVQDGNEYKEKTFTVKLGKDDSSDKDSKDSSEESAEQDSQDSQDADIQGGQDGSEQDDADVFADDGETSLFRDFEQNGLHD